MGREFVKQITEQQSFDEVWVIARRLDRLEEIKNEVNCPVRCISLDLTKQEAWDEYKALLEEHNPEVKVLVNASGYGKFGAFCDMPLDEQLGMIDLNDKALVAVTYITLPYLRSGSEVYQVDSLSSFQPVPYISVYAATKAFVLSFTRAVNSEMRHTGIKMMAVCPGWVKTEFFDRAVTDESVITYYNQFFTSEQVVKRALRDMKKKKDVSVCGFKIRAQVLLTKLIPHTWVMKIWLMQQKKK
jgi:short-subunit dehydrogenase